MLFNARLFTGAALLAAAAVSPAQAEGFATYHAVVLPTGATQIGSGVMSSTKTATGSYTVTFSRSVTGCAYFTTVRGGTPGFTAANIGTGNKDSVVVKTFSKTGAAADLSFYLLVQCNN
jgi:hypothetical protein